MSKFCLQLNLKIIILKRVEVSRRYEGLRWSDLEGGPPDCLHGEGDEAGDGISDGEVIHQIVNIGPAPLKKK